ncbi:NAD(+) diphosphatase [Conexibacter sp. CPCC 206217]|uniref:NAD(+) diphosphatase n=1 Tax=Conexibacter sp. CPCC 206217 TaxID=3064574 RepID=UPI0027216439|nr:NAD(+) diphosphatase [Conexibacter sp. CPCC 206217]MDO8211327.1 NAD(+) diphosphatase [Conexibacter sp. CPCC 206217]
MALPNTFSGSGLDRAGARRRDAAWVQERLHHRSSRTLAVTRDGILVTGRADAPELVRLPLELVPGGAGTTVLLGVEQDGGALFAVDVDHIHAHRPLTPGARALGLREAGGLLSQELGGLAAYASALLGWHRSHPHCARCGAVTDVAEGGHLRRCPVCHAEHHPRTDPVVIMLVLDGDRVLLGRQRSWPQGRYSALAGFVETAESLEEAVAREVLEEAGVAVRDARYVSSQPWPFPSSLMLGFTAEYAGGEPVARDGELEDVRWFTRDEVTAAAALGASSSWDATPDSTGLLLPPPLAIARRLVDGWLAG